MIKKGETGRMNHPAGSFEARPSAAARLKVLFIGNSHTYLHYMPQMVTLLAAGADPPIGIDTCQVTGEGVDLRWHAENDATTAQITAHPWDAVVLQERSGGPLADSGSMFSAARRLDRRIRARGARTVFFMTWARRDRPDTQAAIADAYFQISRELGARIAPVGLAWQQAGIRLPGLPLYHRDGRHAGALGAYLTACVFTFLLTHAGPVPLPAEIVMDNRKKVSLPVSTARRLQQIAFGQLTAAESRTAAPPQRP